MANIFANLNPVNLLTSPNYELNPAITSGGA